MQCWLGWVGCTHLMTDIGSGRVGLGQVYCDPKPNPIETGFDCLKPDSIRKIGSIIRSVFRISGWTLLFFFNQSYSKLYWIWRVIPSLCCINIYYTITLTPISITSSNGGRARTDTLILYKGACHACQCNLLASNFNLITQKTHNLNITNQNNTNQQNKL